MLRSRRKFHEDEEEFTVKFCAWLEFQEAKEKSGLEGTFGKRKGTTKLPFIANTLKKT